jgi:SAM-dependent methyltransferase
MCHSGQRRFVEHVAHHLGRFFRECEVLEVGSLDLNGSVRDYFHNCRYTGIDVAEGKGVDVVCQGQEYNAPDNTFDHVISCEAMEHNPYWAPTFANMLRMCKPGGLVLMTCATAGRAEHGTVRKSREASPLTVGLGWNYYRNLLPNDFLGTLDFPSAFSRYRFWLNWRHYDLFFCGLKSGHLNSDVSEWDSLVKRVDDYVSAQNQQVGRYRALVARHLGDRWFRFMRWICVRFGSKVLNGLDD